MTLMAVFLTCVLMVGYQKPVFITDKPSYNCTDLECDCYEKVDTSEDTIETTKLTELQKQPKWYQPLMIQTLKLERTKPIGK